MRPISLFVLVFLILNSCQYESLDYSECGVKLGASLDQKNCVAIEKMMASPAYRSLQCPRETYALMDGKVFFIRKKLSSSEMIDFMKKVKRTKINDRYLSKVSDTSTIEFFFIRKPEKIDLKLIYNPQNPDDSVHVELISFPHYW